MAGTRDHRDISASATRSATRFFWCWLVVATLMSVCGNVAHALLGAADGYRAMAAVAALVPPVTLIAGMESTSHLVRTRAGGTVYWVALVATLLLAMGAFVLSFDALRSVAILVGIRAPIAWMWPAVIDVSIAQATLCLLSLTRATGAASDTVGHHGATTRFSASGGEPSTAPDHVALPTAVTIPPPRTAITGRCDVAAAPEPRRARPLPAVGDSAHPGVDTESAVNAAAVRRWQPVADSFVRAGITPRTEARVVATILAEREAGTRATTIEKRHKVHHSTVKKVLAAADQLPG